MTSPLRHWLFTLLVVAFACTACASSDGDQAQTVAETDEVSQEDAEPADEDRGGTDDAAADEQVDGSDVAVPENDPAAEEAIAALDGEAPPEVANADPLLTATEFVRRRFNIDPDPVWVSCMNAQSAGDETLELALRTPSVASGDVDDTQLKSLTFAMNGCVDSFSLADWATQAVGPQGEVRETAPGCFAERFDDPERGDTTFYTLVALTYQFRVEPDGVPDITDALVSCTPITSLVTFFANTAEQNTGYETIVDRECLTDAVADPATSELFWSTLIEGLTPPIEIVDPYVAECSKAANAGLADTIPDDFEPWSGTGALAEVAPPARAGAYAAPPPMTIDIQASYEAVLVTGGGEIRIRLFADTAPVTVNNFVNLARDGYFDGIVFHRVLDDFMAQTGDPSGSGSGGPGYTFDDEVDDGPELDRAGLVAMANSGPDTNGSQFFITFVETDWLTGLHTVFGEVTEGIDIVNAIERRDPLAPQGRGQVLESVMIIES